MLYEWRAANDSQGAMHLVHLLAAKLAGAKPGVAIDYSERDVDFVFCNRFLRVNDSDLPYFDPFDMSHRIGSHPHSNVATARKKTFSDKWKAGEFSVIDGKTTFTLATDYATTLRDKMSKRGLYTGLAPEALACWLYREFEFPDDALITDVVDRFRTEFGFDDEEWATLFTPATQQMGWNLELWSPPRDRAKSQTVIDVMTRDVDGFSLQRSLMAIREISKVPLITPDQIIATLSSLGCRQLVIQGPPGTGKTRLAKQVVALMTNTDPAASQSKLASVDDKGAWGLVQFHPSYGYEDFIQRMVPQQDDEGKITVKIVDMPFLVACSLAREIAPAPFVLVIDEMNRAELQNVFGELMYALEYRAEPVTLQYSRSPLIVPENLYLIGTMNTADSSVVQVDYAIRRRFVFLDAPPDRQVIETTVADERVKKASIALFNATMAACNHHPRFSIGHSYFLRSDLSSLANGYVYQVLPVLRAYQDNGVIAEDAIIQPTGWDGDPITPHQVRPDVLVESLTEWAGSL